MIINKISWNKMCSLQDWDVSQLIESFPRIHKALILSQHHIKPSMVVHGHNLTTPEAEVGESE